MVYLGLFLIAFIAATLLPAQSEAALAAAIVEGYAPWLLVAVATVGNVLGSAVNWWLGRELNRFGDRRWFPVKPAQLARARGWYGRYGRWSLLLSWVPVIGDPLTLVAGVMREPLRTFVPLVAFAKLARYLVVAAVALRWV
ncbi:MULTISPECIES: YqaA family protein [Lysobacter]|uniref:Transmembrane protein n=2 Tax=Lysobacter TaxID=68 RepID=A0A0S2DG57_LYSEN|nr:MULTISPECIES: YqaA family protein [Lysobacter]ALN57358.1 transmembrane protein [Lysobacter enzymogenes]QCW25984.1 DedA family protein [Lysobacter enzymogenes]QQP99452.1 DedA family protein [Lysobacter enzymogenes]WMT02624.1 YqaA family protein [Lysobacter yananisis]